MMVAVRVHITLKNWRGRGGKGEHHVQWLRSVFLPLCSIASPVDRREDRAVQSRAFVRGSGVNQGMGERENGPTGYLVRHHQGARPKKHARP